MIGKMVLVRTYSAGVHYGRLRSHNGREAELRQARRIWSWRGANTLHELSLRGGDPGSRISETVKSILLTEVIEIIPCEQAAIENIGRRGWST